MATKAIRARVATYNVLSPSLCSQSVFPACNANDTDATIRFERVLQHLEQEVNQQSIIALQEVALQWVGPLHSFFKARGYDFIATNYGKEITGHMGVALAVPPLYQIEELDIARVTDEKHSGWSDTLLAKPSKPPALVGALQAAASFTLKPFGVAFGSSQQSDAGQCWRAARSRENRMIFARLREAGTEQQLNGDTWCIATYHAPCEFYDPPRMSIACALCFQRAHRLAAGSPYVVLGDFNQKPDEPGSLLARYATLPATHKGQPPRQDDEGGWSIDLPQKLKSAYYEVNGKEPDVTNYAQFAGKEPFAACLDYIFLSPECSARDVKQLSNWGEIKGSGPFPNVSEPSDHLLLAANLRIRLTTSA